MSGPSAARSGARVAATHRAAAAASPLLAIADRLSRELGALAFRPPVAFVYNPLDYARDAYAVYVERYAGAPKEAIFVGMNPGPFGMAQTGVPFGEVCLAVEMGCDPADIGKTIHPHPTLSESIGMAAELFEGVCTDLPPARKK